MPNFLELLPLVPALPFAGFLISSLLLGNAKPALRVGVCLAAIGLSTLLGWGAAWQYFTEYAGQTIIPWQTLWLSFSENLPGNVGVLADDLSINLVIVVTTVSFLVHVYSIGYMRGDKGIARFFAFLNLFSCAMLGLVLSISILQIFVFWELVGLSSFLLIGYYWQRPSAVAACKKAFIVTRFADLGFLLGLLVLSYYAGGLDFDFLNSPATLERLAETRLPLLGIAVLPLSAVLVFMGAAGKSAMFPLHIWLPDAMEGPTPVSALIHAATMVVAGVYLVGRLFPLYAASEFALDMVRWIGAFTALFAAIIATTQFDIKRVLAFSTLSQIGYMMLALGCATADHTLGFTAGFFHLTTHAFFKALLFLGAGCIIHAVHSNDLREMGGLRRALPITHATVLIACLTIAGVPPLSGFFSKDEILLAAWENGHYLTFAVALAVAGLTAFYMFRLYFLTFWSTPLDAERAAHAHEAPRVMTTPLIILALFSVVGGFVPFGELVHRGHLDHNGIEWAIAIPAVLMAVGGIAVAFVFYFRLNLLPAKLALAFGPLHSLVYRKFFIDEVYIFVTHQIIFRYCSRPLNWFDRHCVDGCMDLTAQVSRRGGQWLRQTIDGRLQTYLLWAVLGALLLGPALWRMADGVGWAMAALGLLALLVMAGWQWVLNLLQREPPLKRIERD